MFDFHAKSRPRDYSSPRQQWRPLMLILGLGLIIIIGEWVINPEKRRQLMSLGSGASSRADQGGKDGQIDNLLAADVGGQRGDGTPEILALADPADTKEDQTGGCLPGVKPGLLKLIDDDTGYRPEEDRAWFNLLDVLGRSEQSAIEAASPRKASYAQLFRQSAEYRGQLVTVRGTVRGVEFKPARANDFGIKGVYSCWIAPVDNPTSPLVVCCLELPEGFPTGINLVENVKVTGIFFKRWSYSYNNAYRTAPTLLAKTFEWNQRPDFAPQSGGVDIGVLLAAGGAALLTSIALAVVMYRQMRPRRSRPGSAPTATVLPPIGPPPETADGPEQGSSS